MVNVLYTVLAFRSKGQCQVNAELWFFAWAARMLLRFLRVALVDERCLFLVIELIESSCRSLSNESEYSRM